jgi:hypothetical protein
VELTPTVRRLRAALAALLVQAEAPELALVHRSGRTRRAVTITVLPVDTRHLAALRMSPLRIHKMRLHRAEPEEAKWLGATLSRVSGGLGTRVELTADAQLLLSDL